MTTREWTKEPWTGNSWIITKGPSRSGDGMNMLAKFEFPDTDANATKERHHNCVRAVACVNACAPLSDPTTSIPALLRVAEAARKLLLRLEVVHSDPDYQAVWALSQLHGGQYAGPTYTEEKAALDTALSTLPASDERGFT